MDIRSFYIPPQTMPGMLSETHVDRHCHGTISFVPDAEKDDEVAFSWRGKTCHAAVNEVVRSGDTVEPDPVPVSVAPDC